MPPGINRRAWSMSSARDIEEHAATLLARLDSDFDNPELLAEIRQWTEADPRHEVAYLRLRATWRHLDRLQALGSYENATTHFDKSNSASRLPTGRRFAWAAAVAGLALALAGSCWWAVWGDRAAAYVISTAIGGYERQVLADGSTLELNTDSAAEIDFRATARHVRLLRGEGRFLVAKDTRRPFLVEVGTHSVRALGTDFTVWMKGAATEVLVSDGRVRLESTQPGDRSATGTTASLDPGQLALLTSGSVHIRTLAPQEIDARLAWDRGLLVFAGDTLEEVAAEFNRYNTTKLHVADPAAGALRIDGTFRATNMDAFVSLLARGFPVAVARSGSTVTITTQAQTVQP